MKGKDPKRGRRYNSIFAGLEVVSSGRGGFYPALKEKFRKESIEDNKRAMKMQLQCGAWLVVLVCGAGPGQSLVESRKQIIDGIAAYLALS